MNRRGFLRMMGCAPVAVVPITAAPPVADRERVMAAVRSLKQEIPHIVTEALRVSAVQKRDFVHVIAKDVGSPQWWAEYKVVG